MIRSTLLGLAAAFALTVSASAQTFTPWPFSAGCSGCPGSVVLENSGFTGGGTTMLINTTVYVRASFPAATATDVRASILYMGYRTGNCSNDYSGLVSFNGGGPCNWYIVPLFGEPDLGSFPMMASGDMVTMQLPIPNDRSLHDQGFGFQGLRVNFTSGLWDMTKSSTGVVSIF